MSHKAYIGIGQRSFRQALVHLLENEYRLLGSRKILELLVTDVEQLVEQFFPVPQHLRAGWMVFTGTKASGSKAYPGQTAGEHELVTLAWPVVLPEELQQLAQGLPNTAAQEAWLKKRLVRLVEYGYEHPDGPVLLTLADLSVMLGASTVLVSKLLAEARQEQGKPLMTKGYYFDQGMRPTHKEHIVELYEQGLDEVSIARQSQHAQSSVGRYLRDYERVKQLTKHGMTDEEMVRLLDMQPNVVRTYRNLVRKYHPHLD